MTCVILTRGLLDRYVTEIVPRGEDMNSYSRTGRHEGQVARFPAEVSRTPTQIGFKRILFATDFSPSANAALPYALGIARHYRSKLFAGHVISEEKYLFTTSEDWPTALEQVNSAQIEMYLKHSPRAMLSSVRDMPDVLFRLIHDSQIDLLVIGTRGRSGLPKLLLGSFAQGIFREASIPVLTVGPNVSVPQTNIGEFSRIVFATDFSDQSIAAAAYALSVAKKYRALLSVLHVLEPPQSGTVDVEPLADFAIRRMWETVPRDADMSFRCPEYFVECGDVEEQVLKFAKLHQADLIVLGVRAPERALSAITRLAHSQAEHIVAQAPCPVLTVRG